MNRTPITIVGNLTDDPELRFLPTGDAVCKWTVAVNPRYFNRTTNEWTDGEPTFWGCTAWRVMAENVAESLTKGARVIVTGTVRTERWEDRTDGTPRERTVIDVDDIGPSLTWATAEVTRNARRNPAPADDPWNTATKTPPAANTSGSGSEGADRPPTKAAGASRPPAKTARKSPAKKAPSKSVAYSGTDTQAAPTYSDEPPF
ncbi:single-stranded DNA-binding protein [Embleya sp. NPDC005575]|uniref:single-stranded DNA-binding protein n=1 Tax=Embleya sp. NPDC005575 TaxID=3156892 RepID=UPI0033B3B8C4